MTVTIKIICGFTIMVALMAILALVGYRGIDNSSGYFYEYSRLANIGALIGDINSGIYSITSSNNSDKANSKNIIEFKDVQAMVEKLTVSVTLPETKEHTSLLKSSVEDLGRYLAEFNTGRKKASDFFDTNLSTQIKGMENSLKLMVAQSYTDNNIDALYSVDNVSVSFADYRVALWHYVQTAVAEDAKDVEETLAQMKVDIDTININEDSPDAVTLFNSLIEQHAAMQTSLYAFEKIVEEMHNSDLQSKDAFEKAIASGAFLSSFLTDLRNSYNAAFTKNNSTVMTQMIIFATVGLLLGIIIALFMSISITRTLHKLSDYCARIGNGEFATDSNVSEKGAVGEIVDAIGLMSNRLANINTKIDVVVNKIKVGHFRERYDISKYSNGFKDLGNSINLLADAYTLILDSIPNPIMSCSNDHVIRFLNTSAQGVLGGNKVNEKCAKLLCTKICDTPNCLGTLVLSSNKVHNGEVGIMVNGEPLDIAVLASPLLDNDGSMAGFMEIITDITDIRKRERTIIKSVGVASLIADRLAAASKQLNTQILHVSQGVEQQKVQVDNTSIAMSQMNNTVSAVAESAHQASAQTNDTREKADSGAILVNQVVTSINQVNDVAQILQNNMQDLGTQAESIGSVMSVISDIADQTNLLALNAAIEAARAGEAGRGFAVVADEVRKLAEKTMTATQEVGQSIKAIQNSARINIDEVTTAVSSVNNATNLANSSGQALNEIVDLASSNSNLVTSIATAAEEQSSTSKDINKSIDDIKAVVDDITENMEQSASAVNDLAAMAQELQEVMDKLRVD